MLSDCFGGVGSGVAFCSTNAFPGITTTFPVF